MDDDHLTGLWGRVTGTVRPGHLGEVMFLIRGGREAYFARPYDEAETIPVGAECVVVAQVAPRTVLVTAMPTAAPDPLA